MGCGRGIARLAPLTPVPTRPARGAHQGAHPTTRPQGGRRADGSHVGARGMCRLATRSWSLRLSPSRGARAAHLHLPLPLPSHLTLALLGGSLSLRAHHGARRFSTPHSASLSTHCGWRSAFSGIRRGAASLDWSLRSLGTGEASLG